MSTVGLLTGLSTNILDHRKRVRELNRILQPGKVLGKTPEELARHREFVTKFNVPGFIRQGLHGAGIGLASGLASGLIISALRKRDKKA
jgi:hypothetical protein